MIKSFPALRPIALISVETEKNKCKRRQKMKYDVEQPVYNQLFLEVSIMKRYLISTVAVLMILAVVFAAFGQPERGSERRPRMNQEEVFYVTRILSK